MNRFVKRIKITQKSMVYYDVELYKSSGSNGNLQITIIAGENGAGKSFLLYQLIEMIKYLHGTRNGDRLNYESYELTLDSGETITKGHRPKGIKDKIPSRVLFCSNSVFDKSVYSRNSNFYRYLGMKTFHGEIADSALGFGFVYTLYDTIRQNRFHLFEDVLKSIGYDAISVVENNTTQTILIDKNEIINVPQKQLGMNNFIITFHRGDIIVFWDWLSSGEKLLLKHLVGIIGNITNNSLIIVDEPEISLHPKWQVEYLHFLADIATHFLGCQFIVATHSHLLFSTKYSLQYDISVLSVATDSRTHSSKLIPHNTRLPDSVPYSILYEVFKIPTAEYHIELYDMYISNLPKEKSGILAADGEIERSPFFDRKLHEKPSSYGKSKYKTLPTFIRNVIHHPNNGNRFTEQELIHSIELLRILIEK